MVPGVPARLKRKTTSRTGVFHGRGIGVARLRERAQRVRQSLCENLNKFM
jgi:hypothetical protein